MPTRATPCPDTTPAAVTALPGALEPDWLEDGTPYSARYGDVYYTRGDGAAEAEHVFLAGNALAERWRALPDSAERPFLIAETGFGTGLNFLLALRLWRAVAPRGARLLFRSVEAQPLSREALSRALAAWPSLGEARRELIDRWPPALAGLHALDFDDGRVTLHLYIGEAGDALEEFQAAVDEAPVDAWFLDGFAPARNPEMWRSEVLARIAALTRSGGTLATFTSAAAVRRGLQDTGFAMRKVPGFGRKREMLCGTREAGESPVTAPFPAQAPWHRAEPATLGGHRAIVVGAGIAGCLTARALVLRGWEVLVLEASDAIAEGASGNPQGLLYTQLPAADSAHGEFTLASYIHACRTHAALLRDAPSACGRAGLLCLPEPGEEATQARLAERYAALGDLVQFLDREEASRLAGVALASGAAYLPASGWIDPREACARALSHPRIRVQTGSRVDSLTRTGECWALACADGSSHRANAVVLANAAAAAQLLPAGVVRLESVRGQITFLPANALPGDLRVPLSGEGYLLPARDGLACCGASFLRGREAGEPSAEENAANLGRVAALLPGFRAEGIDAGALAARVALRCASPDRLPLAGRVPDVEAFRSRFAALRKNARRPIPRRGAFLPGLALSVAHGSRGLTSAPLCAEVVAAELSGEPLPVTARVARALSPARFLLRAIIRGEEP